VEQRERVRADARPCGEHHRRYDAWREVLAGLLRRRGIGLHAVLDPSAWPAERQLAHLDRVLGSVAGPSGPAPISP
jgi:hypothetical protein